MVVWLLVGSSTAWAQAWDLAGTSMRDVAMAGAGAAGGDAGVAIPIDPAAVAAVDGEVATLTWRGNFPSVQTTTDTDLVTDAVHGVDLGIAVARPLGEGTAVGAGFDFYLPLPDAVSTVVHIAPTDPQAPLLEDTADFAGVNATSAVRLGPLELGLGAAIGMDLLAETDIVLLSLLGEDTPEGFDVSDSAAVTVRRRLTWSVAPLIGVHFRHERLDAYLSWRGQGGFRTTGDQALEVVLPLIDPITVDIPVSYLSAWSPGRLSTGVAGHLGAVHPEVGARLIMSHTFADAQVREPPDAFKDVLAMAVGVEVDLVHGLHARAGYSYIPSPVPAQDVERSRFADADRHVVGIGGALRIADAPRDGDHTEVALAIQTQQLTPGDQSFAAQGSWLTATAGVQTRF